MVHVRGTHLHQALPMPKQRTHGADFLFRTIRSTQQADRMQELKPLAVRDVSTPAGYVLHMPRIHQAHLEAAVLQNLE